MGTGGSTLVPQAAGDRAALRRLRALSPQLQSRWLGGESLDPLRGDGLVACLAPRSFSVWPGVECQRDRACLVAPDDRVRALDLDGIALSELPIGTLEGLSALVRLNLERNALTSVKTGSLPLARLTLLYLAHNSITRLEHGVFDDCVSLRDLGLSHNALRELPPGLCDRLVKLQSLWLNHNQLQCLPPHLLRSCVEMDTFSVQGNEGYTGPSTLAECRAADGLPVATPAGGVSDMY